MFSNYKNTITGTVLIGIAPDEMGLFLSDICLPLVHVLVSPGLLENMREFKSRFDTC